MRQIEGGKWLCMFCQKFYSRKDNLKTHILNNHMGNQQVTCQVCMKTCKNPNALRAHTSIYHKHRVDDALSAI